MGLFGSVSYKKNLRRSLRDNYGRTPDPFYSAGDMATIRSYYDHMREHDPDTFRVDDVTWSDLDMDRVFKPSTPASPPRASTGSITCSAPRRWTRRSTPGARG